MPLIKIWVHFVWATKNRQPMLNKENRKQLFAHIKENGKTKNIHVDFVNGYLDHVHVLVSLNAEQTVAKVAQLLKGESSYWANKNNLFQTKLAWQDDYFAVGLSESAVNIVREYIKNQEAHHQTKSFQEEYDEFMQKYGCELIEG